jgi:23S rRNA-intervening sequence protein
VSHDSFQPGGTHHHSAASPIGGIGCSELPGRPPGARSRADFISKLGIVLEEADESLFWLELLVDAGLISSEKAKMPLCEANELVAIFVTSLLTAK